MSILIGSCAELVAAVSLPVTNPGFEDITGATSVFNEFTFGSFAGWDLYDDPPGTAGNGASEPFFVGTLQPFPDPLNPGQFVFFPNGAPEGTRVAIAFNRAGAGGTGEYGLEQTLVGVPLQPHRTYTLQVEIGNIDTGIAMSGENFPLEGFPGYRVDLLAGGQILDSDNNSLAGSVLDGEFATSSFSFTTGAMHALLGQDLGIRLVNLNEIDPMFPSANLEVDFDDVRLDVTPAIVGDFNFDGAVNSADYVVWRSTLGSTTQLAADSNNSGQVDEADYADWRANFGATATPIQVVSIPEPSTPAQTIMLLSITACHAALLARGRAA